MKVFIICLMATINSIVCLILGAKIEELVEAFGKPLPDWTGAKIGVVIWWVIILIGAIRAWVNAMEIDD